MGCGLGACAGGEDAAATVADVQGVIVGPLVDPRDLVAVQFGRFVSAANIDPEQLGGVGGSDTDI